jgi:hypothetical protein
LASALEHERRRAVAAMKIPSMRPAGYVSKRSPSILDSYAT